MHDRFLEVVADQGFHWWAIGRPHPFSAIGRKGLMVSLMQPQIPRMSYSLERANTDLKLFDKLQQQRLLPRP